jgi:hypothetical protein
MAGVLGNRKLNLENISADEVLVNSNGSQAYVKAEVGEKIYVIGNKPYVLIKFSDACLTTLTEAEAKFSSSASVTHEQLEQSGYSGGSSDDKARFLCGIPNEEAMARVVRAVDSASSNRFQLIPGAVTPAGAVIPMRSNTQTYGPYPSDNFNSANGGCVAEQNTDLAPWVFGGSAAMDTAGYALANSMQTGLNEGASGSITLLGLPQLSHLGSSSVGNPNLTGISVNFGSSGITTNYSFQTFTPKFGDLTKSAVEQMKNVARNRQKQLQFLRNQAIMSYNTNRKLKRVDNKKEGKKDNVGIAEGKTLTRCMIGEIYNWYEQESGNSQRTVVGMDSLAKTALELRYGYDKKAFMSLDGLFGPVSKSGDGGLPQYSSYAKKSSGNTSSQSNKASPISPQPPLAKTNTGGDTNNIVMDQYNLDINQKYYDPLTNKITSNSHHHEGSGAGHAIDLLGRKSTPPNEGMLMNELPQDDQNRYADDYRFLGLRGPLVLHSWGYDTNGKPVPNAADTDSAAGSGQFTSEQLKDKFLKDWLNKPKTWPVAPVDLRFDRDRGMWVSPQQYKIVVAKLKEDLSPNGSAQAYLINQTYGDKLYDADGAEILADGSSSSQAIINVVDRIGQEHKKNDHVYAYYDSYKSEYIIVSGGGAAKIVKFALVDNKDIRDRSARAVLVDKEGYPIDSSGQKLTSENFNDNLITVNDPFRIRYNEIPGQPSAFGPALGGKTFQEHIEGIAVDDGWENNITKIGPFIGFAVAISDTTTTTPSPSTPSPDTPSSLSDQTTTSPTVPTTSTAYQIVQLEKFAQFVVGKIATVKPEDGTYYYAARLPQGFANGVAPVTRNKVGDKFNLRVNYPLNQFLGGEYIIGDLIDGATKSTGLYDQVDGCVFIAELDNFSSDFSSTKENLVYTIVETEHVAMRGIATPRKQQEAADILNNGAPINADPENTKITTTFSDGFIWNKNTSEKHYREIQIYNKESWIGKPFITKDSSFDIIISSNTEGQLVYKINNGDTIARVFDCTATGGKTGSGPTDNERKVTVGNLYLGSAAAKTIENPPKFTLDGHKWMTYDGSKMYGIMNEHAVGGAVEKADLYKIIYAREAPTIMTGTTSSGFTPKISSNISIQVTEPSGPGSDKAPVTTLITKIENPMGYGAGPGDRVTVQRYYTGTSSSSGSGSSNDGAYKYIVIGTGAPPGSGGGSSSSSSSSGSN